MEPRPQSPRSSHGQPPAGPGRPPEDTGTQQQPDPTTVVAPPRADYDYSPLDLAPPGQRRKRQLVAAGIGAVVLALLIAAVVFATITLTNDDNGDDGDLAALQALAATATVQAMEAGTPDAAEEGDFTEPENTSNEEATEEGGAPDDQVVADDPASSDDEEGEGSLDEAGERAALEPTEVPDSGPSVSSAPSESDLEAMLPSQGAVPQGLDMVEDSTRTQEEVVGALGGNREAELNLDEWGWSANVERSFMASDPASLLPDATTTITVSLHGFASDSAAAEALVFYSDILLDLGYSEVEVGQLGENSRMLEVIQEDGGTTVALYVQEGPVLYRLGGYSPGGDPSTNVVNVAETMLGG